ncbi:hypothetical protein BCR42DRAFT_425218 [Absidia repens]|uniref:Fms-interacting protein-domain-containing protein n=1 Tax=Absidia repens TaxID=90262 RepID=A0A1X2I2M0_9FUNG|nr:hypothetical protein BCR42DRAFT_425218 [Absidia repens]
MSTEPTTSSDSPPLTSKGKREKQLDALCKKYIDHLIELTSIDSLAKHFDQNDIKDAELGYASEQMTDYARHQLWESLRTLFEEERVKERLDSLERLKNNRTAEDYEAVYENSIRQYGDEFYRILPKPKQVTQAELYRLKKKELERLHALRDSLRHENKAKMEELNNKKQIREELVNKPLLEFTPPNLDPSLER